MGHKKTNLEQVKSVAKSFLYLDIHTTSLSPVVVKHPFFDSGITGIKSDDGWKMVNILESESDLRQVRKLIEQQIDDAETAMIISMYITKPYKLTFLKFIKQYLSSEDIGSYLALNWSFVENPSRDVNVSKKEIVRLFRSADTKTLLTDEEQEALDNLDENSEIYRGVTAKGLNAAKGLSWTLSINKARYFANRFNRGGYVYKAYISKEHILAYITDRSEDEIVVDYTQLHDIQLIEEIQPGGEKQ